MSKHPNLLPWHQVGMQADRAVACTTDLTPDTPTSRHTILQLRLQQKPALLAIRLLLIVTLLQQSLC